MITPVEALIFQASSFQLLKLENLLRWSFFTSIYNRSSNIWIISYILHLFHAENGLDAGIRTCISRDQVFPFSSARAYPCVWAATSETEVSIRHNTKIRIFTTLGYVWPMKTLDLEHLAPEQFSKMVEGSDDFACACVVLVISAQPLGLCLRLCLRHYKKVVKRRRWRQDDA